MCLIISACVDFRAVWGGVSSGLHWAWHDATTFQCSTQEALLRLGPGMGASGQVSVIASITCTVPWHWRMSLLLIQSAPHYPLFLQFLTPSPHCTSALFMSQIRGAIEVVQSLNINARSVLNVVLANQTDDDKSQGVPSRIHCAHFVPRSASSHFFGLLVGALQAFPSPSSTQCAGDSSWLHLRTHFVLTWFTPPCPQPPQCEGCANHIALRLGCNF